MQYKHSHTLAPNLTPINSNPEFQDSTPQTQTVTQALPKNRPRLDPCQIEPIFPGLGSHGLKPTKTRLHCFMMTCRFYVGIYAELR